MPELNRTKAPAFAIPEKLYPVEPERYDGKLDFPIYMISAGTEPIVRLDFIFQAGSRYQNELFVSACTNSLLVEGTKSKTGKEIAEAIDFMGSYFIPFHDRDEAGMTLYCLEKHLEKSLILVLDVLQNPSFPKDEIEIFVAKKYQNIILDEQKPEQVAGKEFLRNIFGSLHQYGVYGKIEDLSILNAEKSDEFHQAFYKPSNMEVILTSRDCGQHIHLLENLMAEWNTDSSPFVKEKALSPINGKAPSELYLNVEQAAQTSIRLGKLMPDRHHPDYPILSVINTLLGGYFGSRLMQNIREEKGYTYGIGSTLVSYKEHTILTIGSNVSSEYYSDAIKECFVEIKKLREILVPEEELKRVKNYLIGDLQRQLDGPFNIADTFKAFLFHGLNFSDLDRIQKVLFDLNPENLRELASEHLQDKDFHIIAAGRKE